MMFGLAMTLSLGIKAPLNFSVFSAAKGSLLLATCLAFPFNVDVLRRPKIKLTAAIVVLDTDDSILRVNPEFTRIFSYAEEEALGRPINELVVPEELWAEAEEYIRRGTRGDRNDAEAQG
jgi:PAS domain-containing protein